ncbi:hypothetical protein ACVNNN_19005 [Lysinibacillus fusiformis]|jgi:glucose-6-phosphate 1-dehydrogenase|uniref:hypothetical protein n=1 Tax=Lysinibacillus sp. PWR01 TaxID=3342384 RepID=UPI00372D3337
MIALMLLILLSALLFVVRQKLNQKTYEKKYQLLRRLKEEGFVEVDEGYPVLYLSMETAFFEEIARILGENTCRPMIIVLEAPLWYASLQKKQWAQHLVIPHIELKEWFSVKNDSFILVKKGVKILEIKFIKEFLQIENALNGL